MSPAPTSPAGEHYDRLTLELERAHALLGLLINRLDDLDDEQSSLPEASASELGALCQVAHVVRDKLELIHQQAEALLRAAKGAEALLTAAQGGVR